LTTDVDITGPAVIADISGRHYNEDAAVVAVLETIRQKVGGDVSAAP